MNISLTLLAVLAVILIDIAEAAKFKKRRYKRFHGKKQEEMRAYLGMLRDANIESAKLVARSAKKSFKVAMTLPVNFTINDKWPECSSVFNIIPDQSNCGGCWAVATAAVIQDRRCIKYGKPKESISSWDLISCCAACRGFSKNGCNGGYPTEAFKYFKKTGVVTGGKYKGKGCKPYKIKPNATKQPKKTKCSRKCKKSYKKLYKNDKKHGKAFKVFSMDNDAVMQEIYMHGSVLATFTVYNDLYDYVGGVYQHENGRNDGGHAVRIVGWGVYNNTPYWRVANSWGTEWGESGFFNMIRNVNECSFEEGIVTGTVKKD